MDVRGVGVTIMLLGALAIVVGFFVFRGWFGWFGRLPGDIRIVSDSTRIYIPVTSMLVVSVVLSLLLNLVRRLW